MCFKLQGCSNDAPPCAGSAVRAAMPSPAPAGAGGGSQRGASKVGQASGWPSPLRRTAHAGFTLIEVMVVVVILGILGALIVPNIMGRPDEAKATAAAADLRSIGNALELYRLDNGTYPSTEQGLQALVEQPSGFPEAKHWNQDGYVSKLPVDPWDEPYMYISEGRSFDVYSYGADRAEGGEGVDADLYLSKL